MPLWKQAYQRIEQPLEFAAKLVSYVGALAVILGWLSQFSTWGNSGPFLFIRNNLQTLWLAVASISIVTLWIWTTRLNRRFINRFTDSFTGDLRKNWDFDGPWRIAEENTLLVTGSDAGGLTKVGATWENYTFSFEARITHQCLGVIVRAQDLNNYYMLQINKDAIKPHRRASIPLFQEGNSPKNKSDTNETTRLHIITFGIGWQVFEPPISIDPNLTGWFKVRIVVRGEAVKVYINDELQFHEESFLKIPTGKVGFRNDAAEAALVRNVKVIVQP